ncbi:MAG: tetraacyldisaccharide 4'-kinase, partial [Bacteroidota bacterium]
IGIEVRSMMSFEDHHSYSGADIQKILAEQEKLKAEYIITTEKDMARLTSFDFSDNYPLFYLEMEVSIHQEEEWKNLITSVLGKRNNG